MELDSITFAVAYTPLLFHFDQVTGTKLVEHKPVSAWIMYIVSFAPSAVCAQVVMMTVLDCANGSLCQ